MGDKIIYLFSKQRNPDYLENQDSKPKLLTRFQLCSLILVGENYTAIKRPQDWWIFHDIVQDLNMGIHILKVLPTWKGGTIQSSIFLLFGLVPDLAKINTHFYDALLYENICLFLTSSSDWGSSQGNSQSFECWFER